MIFWEVSMKFEQFNTWFQILQIMEKHYAGGHLKRPPAVRHTLAVIISQPPAQWFAKI
jgi:hypothetical protein